MTAEQILKNNHIHNSIKGDIDLPYTKEFILEAMNEYAELKWKEGCDKLLKDISNTFLDGVRKADKESDKDIYQAIGETIQDFPIPNYKLSLHIGA